MLRCEGRIDMALRWLVSGVNWDPLWLDGWLWKTRSPSRLIFIRSRCGIVLMRSKLGSSCRVIWCCLCLVLVSSRDGRDKAQSNVLRLLGLNVELALTGGTKKREDIRLCLLNVVEDVTALVVVDP